MNTAHALANFLDSREKAAVFWLAVLLAYATLKTRREISSPLRQAVHTRLGWKLLLLFGSAAAYCAFIAFAASRIGLWHTSGLKETIYWYFTGAAVLVGRAASHGRPSDPAFYRRLVRDAVTWTVVIEFLVNLYVFPLAVELILVPLIILFVAMQSVASYQPAPGPAGRLIDIVLALIATSLLVQAVVAAVGDPAGVFARENVETLLIAPALTVAIIPLLWTWGWISQREQRNLRKRLQIQYHAGT